MKNQDNTVEALAILCLTLIAVVAAYALSNDAATVVGTVAGMIGGYLTKGLTSTLKESRKMAQSAERDRAGIVGSEQGEVVVAIAIALGVWMVGGIIFHAARAKGVF